MKVIFLDIDGVLNAEEENGKNTGRSREDFCEISVNKFQLLKQITDTTGAGIVLSSSWRLDETGRNTVKKFCKQNNMVYLGETPDEVEVRNFAASNTSCSGTTHQRGAQILSWITQQKFTGEYIVLDDETQDILPWIPEEHLVQTTLWEGLTENKVKESIKKLLN